MTGAELKEALHAGTHVYGTCVTVAGPLWPAVIASTGVDFVFIDTEHIPLGRPEMTTLCQAFDARRIAPIVRIPRPDPYLACMALDAGAAGVVAPYVETVAEAQALRGAVSYRPLKGARLQAVLDGTETLDDETAAYLHERNKDKLMILNIESRPAMDNLRELVAVPGLDALLIGPHDLSINLGMPERYDDPVYTAAIQKILETGRAAGLGAGFHFGGGVDLCKDWIERGANLIIHSTDQQRLSEAFRDDFTELRSHFGDHIVAGGDAPDAV
jgi:4-hydroxy-2-oxoheptanedioate aldolase